MPGRVLGVDLGTKRVGIAMTDSGGTLASPHKVLPRTPQLYREIAAIVDDWEVEQIVVGLPLNMDGSTGPSARSALADVERLRDTLSVPVDTYDERLTTVSADRYLQEAGMNSKKRRAVIDMVAAAVILDSWLDLQKKRKEEEAQ